VTRPVDRRGPGAPPPDAAPRVGAARLGLGFAAPVPAPVDPQRASAVFGALADPTRRALVEALGREGAATATQLSAEFPVSRQAIAKHLTTLASAGVVAGDRVGREQRYRLEPQAFEPAVAWMAAVGTAWEQRLDALKRQVERRP